MALELKPYTGWKPFHMRAGRGARGGAVPNKEGKRSRLGNRHDRALYKHCKDPSNIRYIQLCEKADTINGIRRLAPNPAP